MVSALGLGLAALGRPGYINLGHAEDLNHNYREEAMRSHAHQVLDAAYLGGVRYFDAARSYGRAEDFLGTWIEQRAFKPGDITVGSKWGYTYTADWRVDAGVHEVKEHSPSVLRRQYGETRSNLGAHLDLYQIHSVTLESGVLTNSEVHTQLARLKSTGLLIGFSVSGPQQAAVIEDALQVEVDGIPLFDSVQVTWNLLERSTTRILKHAHNAGTGIIVKETLANGRLTDKNNNPNERQKLNVLNEQARRLNTTVDGLALSAVLCQHWADVVLSGAATAAHMQSNLKALSVVYDEEAQSRLSEMVEKPEVYWQTRSSLAWN